MDQQFRLSSVWVKVYCFFISDAFISNIRLKSAKNQASAKQQPEAEFFLFENYSHSSSTLSSKNNRTCSKKQAEEQMYLYSWDYAINHNENENEDKKFWIFWIRKSDFIEIKKGVGL